MSAQFARQVSEVPLAYEKSDRSTACLLKEAGLPVTLFAGKETTHNKINADLGKADDPATKALFEFLDKALKK